MTLNVLASLLGLTFAALAFSIYANTEQKRVLATWAASAVFLLSATIEWIAGAKLWIVLMLYVIAALQVVVAIRQQLRGHG